MDNQLLHRVHSEIKEVLRVVSKKRKSTQFFQKIMWAVTGLYFLLVLLNMGINYFPNSESQFILFCKQFQPSSSDPYANIYPFVGLVILLYLTTYFFTKNFQNFKLTEAEAIEKMVKTLFPRVEFSQNTLVPSKEIMKSKLFTWVKANAPMYSYGQIRSSVEGKVINIADIGIVEDNVSNKLKGTLMRIPFLNLFVILYEYVFKNIATNKSADNVYYTFRGMFCWMNFKKSLSGHTVILTNNQSSKLNRYFSSKFKEEERVNLEDPRFTNEFIVYSTDQVEARYVLSMAIMEKIVLLKEKFNQPILLSFQDKQMYLAVQNENGLFSFPSGKLDSENIIEELFNDINTALQINSELKLN